ncbi:uncharacterized protein LOC117566110 [Drosophila albomicans]|uniref:Uncharacterized protein LOC117566110 n=1 Tax=Drosophila albomicans TaxID=7291 RepID=A0A6P8WT40_DROAB|nr:uncharacterized protein LOC117566110 [Drosophila albomicans]
MQSHSLKHFTFALALILAVESQPPPPPPLPIYYYGNWLYAMPWQPLAVAPPPHPSGTAAQPLDTQQLSLGYTGPQFFPVTPAPATASATAATTAQPQPRRRPILLGLLTPHPAQGQFTLPFRPSPFAGYSEAAFSNPTEEASDEQQIGEDQQQQHFIYMSPGTLYNLVSN